MHRLPVSLIALMLASTAAQAQVRIESDGTPAITVTGRGQAQRDPDFALLGYSVRGEGANAVEAMAEAEKSRAAINAGLRGLPGKPRFDERNQQFAVEDVRSRGCYAQNRNQPTPGAEDCKVIGAIATLSVRARVWPADRFGDVASMVAQQGGKTPTYQGGGLDSETPLMDAAADAAVADARQQAAALARRAGLKLGRVLRMQDGFTPYTPYGAIGGNAAPPPPPPPPPPAPPPPPLDVSVAFRPEAIARTAQVTMTFQLVE